MIKWICKIRRTDILMHESLMPREVLLARQGQIELVFHIFSYLKHHQRLLTMVFDDTPIRTFCGERFVKCNWSELPRWDKDNTGKHANTSHVARLWSRRVLRMPIMPDVERKGVRISVYWYLLIAHRFVVYEATKYGWGDNIWFGTSKYATFNWDGRRSGVLQTSNDGQRSRSHLLLLRRRGENWCSFVLSSKVVRTRPSAKTRAIEKLEANDLYCPGIGCGHTPASCFIPTNWEWGISAKDAGGESTLDCSKVRREHLTLWKRWN